MQLAEWRRTKRLSQREAALLIGIDQGRWSRYESGKTKPGFGMLRRIEAATNGQVTLEDFYPRPAPTAAPASREG